MTYASVALLVDGDNIASSFAGQILRTTRDLGPAHRRHAYGDANTTQDWSSAPSFRPVFSGPGKNSADILLSIEAMEMALRDGIDAFVIVTSDGDFAHVAHALRGLGRHVLGLGEKKAPNRFRLACSEFRELSVPGAQVEDAKLEPIDLTVRNILVEQDRKGTGLPVTKLNEFARKEGDIKISEQPERTWARYLTARPHLYDLIGEGSNQLVRVAAKKEPA